MPNWCKNELVISGPAPELERFLNECLTVGQLDFERIVPIPEGADWFKFCCEHWGTKWNARETTLDHNGTRAVLTFDTAWSPPLPVVLAASRQFPTIRFELKYLELDNDFAGVLRAYAGEVLYEFECSAAAMYLYRYGELPEEAG